MDKADCKDDIEAHEAIISMARAPEGHVPFPCPTCALSKRASGLPIGPIRFQVCTLFQWLVGSERLRRRPAGVALERGCDMFDDLFRGHFSERRNSQNVPAQRQTEQLRSH